MNDTAQTIPPPARGGWFKWVVIGCLSFTALVAFGLVGCFFFVMRTVDQGTKAWSELGDKTIRGHPVVEKYLGPVKSVSHLARHSGSMTAVIRYRVVGERDEGEVALEAGFMQFSDQVHPEVKRGFLYWKDKTIDLMTGAEIPHGAPPD